MIKLDTLRFQQQQSCVNCQTSTTPLWRRDKAGSVLCNACGLFLKLHGRPRPINPSKDALKERNPMKGSNSEIRIREKPPFKIPDHAKYGVETFSGSPLEIRRPSHKSINGKFDESIIPSLRHYTSSTFKCHRPLLGDHPLEYNHTKNSQSLTSKNLPRVPTRRSVSPTIDITRNIYQLSYEQLAAQNSSLKTRVGELEAINESLQSRAVKLEQDDINARKGEEIHRQTNSDLLKKLEESQNREKQLKHRFDDVENQLHEFREGISRIKKIRVSDMVECNEISKSQSNE